MYHKKGEFSGSVGAVVQLITGVGIGVLVLIFVGALGGQTYTLVEPQLDAITTNVYNETATVLTGIAVSLAHKPIVSGSVSALNVSAAVPASNYTIDYTLGKVTLNQVLYNNTELKFTYIYGDAVIEGHVKGGIIAGFSALEQVGNYLPIIVLAIVIALVLFLVLGASNRTTGGGNTAL